MQKKEELIQQDSNLTPFQQIYNAVINYFTCLGMNKCGLAQYENQIRTSIEYTLRTKDLYGGSVNLMFDDKLLESFESQFRNDLLMRLSRNDNDLRKSLENRNGGISYQIKKA